MSHEHMHALVRRAADGRKIIKLQARDDSDYSDNVYQFIHKAAHNTNSESIKLNVPAIQDKAADNTDDSSSTAGVAVEVVYVTASASFSGSIAGYSTDTATTTQAANTQVSSNTVLSSASTAAITSSSAAVATAIAPTVGTPQANSKVVSSNTAVVAAVNVASTTATADSSTSQQSTGMTDGAKAGLAIGIILAIGLVAGLFFFCWKRSKKETREELNEKSGFSEKRSSFFGAGSNGGSKRQSADSDKSFGTIHTTATAPRLSLRPVTEFLPAFANKRKSSANPQMSEKSSAWDHRPQNGENPFRDPAAQAQNPFDEGDGSSQHSKKNSYEASEPSTPKNAQLGTAAAVPVSQMAPPRQQNNVYRTQLDFAPSMDDELELKSGQLVRMLHEYDDGWALCIRMDRSQQGVVPRTCLSRAPVKPRQGPPSGRTSPEANARVPPQAAGPTSPVSRKPVPGQAI